MTSTHFYRVFFGGAEQVQLSFLLLLLDVLVAKTLQDYVRLLWLLETDHLDLFGGRQLDRLRQEDFADFTF